MAQAEAALRASVGAQRRLENAEAAVEAMGEAVELSASREGELDTAASASSATALRNRIESLEMFDEFEEWDLLQSHYCITLAVCSNDSNQSTTQVRI